MATTLTSVTKNRPSAYRPSNRYRWVYIYHEPRTLDLRPVMAGRCRPTSLRNLMRNPPTARVPPYHPRNPH